ncbi:hypothetical protein BDV93DRAFT_519903 [Ceratobasidium sp. AG-I]|nr:hypothetical protein BDV93DRAFT_519903 [Ceratobasidium sp. AG-I]
MRGSGVPRSRLVEVGENRFFDDTMLDRSEVGSSEFSSLASWETLSESSVPNMVLCYGQLGRRKMAEGGAPRPQRAAADPWSAGQSTRSVGQQSSMPDPSEDTLTDENLLDRLARSLGSEDTTDEYISEVGSSHSHDGVQQFQESVNTGVAIISSPVKWKGKSVARGEHGSPTTSQHSPTFKRLVRQRFQASIDGNMGSPLSRMAVARTSAFASPSVPSIISGVTQSSTNLSSSGSMASLTFHLDGNGVYYYVIPAGTRFCFAVKVTKIGDESEDRTPTFGRTKTALYSVQMDDPEDICMPLWLHFNAPGLEFWGHSPDTVERVQHSMRIVHTATSEVVGRLSIVVTRGEDVSNARASLGYPAAALDTHRAPIFSSASSGLAAALALTFSPRVFGTPLQSSRSVTTSYTGTDLSASGSMASVVFHLNRDGMHFFVIPAKSKFCFEAPINKTGNEVAPTKSGFGRATASPYVIQIDESDTGMIPLWLHFVPQSTEFWGEAPDVAERLRVSLRIVYRRTDEVVAYLTIIVAQLADVEYLQDELDRSRAINERLSIVEEVSSVDSNGDYVEEEDQVSGDALVGPKTPERSYNVSVSPSRGARSWRGMRSQPGSKHGSPASRRSHRSLGLGTPLSKHGQRTRMRTPVSGHMATYEDYDSVMFEGKSMCSESMFGPELAALIGSTGMISSGALDAMSRAASRTGSLNLGLGFGEKTVVVVPTMMNGVEYYVIRGGVDFRFALQMNPAASKSTGEGELAYGVEIEVGEKEGWKYPEWLDADLDGETGVLEFSGSTRGVEALDEQTLVVYESETGEEVKRIRVVVVPGAN